MKRTATIWLIINFTAIAVFGFVGMGHGAEHDNRSGCLATTATGGNCPLAKTAADDFSFYLTVFRSFSLAIFTVPVLLLLFVYYLTRRPRPVFVLIDSPTSAQHEKRLLNFAPTRSEQFRRWLALHEKRDAVLLY